MISIIIPCYNRENLVVETLNSIKNQTYEDWECIIIDDGSTDNTVSVIERFIKDDQRFRLYNRPIDRLKGPSACRNFGFEKIEGDYVQFFDSDDIMLHNHLELKMNLISGGEYQFVSCSIKCIDFEKELEFINIDASDAEADNFQNYHKNLFESFVTGNFPLMMVAPLWAKDFIKKHMPLKEDMNMLEDHELHARALKNVKSYWHLNKLLILQRGEHDSLTKNFFKNVDIGVNSFLKCAQTVIKLSESDKNLKLSQIKKVLWLFRLSLAQKKYNAADKCLEFIKKNTESRVLKMKIFRVQFFYKLFRFFGHGDTRFKRYLRI